LVPLCLTDIGDIQGLVVVVYYPDVILIVGVLIVVLARGLCVVVVVVTKVVALELTKSLPLKDALGLCVAQVFEYCSNIVVDQLARACLDRIWVGVLERTRVRGCGDQVGSFDFQVSIVSAMEIGLVDGRFRVVGLVGCVELADVLVSCRRVVY